MPITPTAAAAPIPDFANMTKYHPEPIAYVGELGAGYRAVLTNNSNYGLVDGATFTLGDLAPQTAAGHGGIADTLGFHTTALMLSKKLVDPAVSTIESITVKYYPRTAGTDVLTGAPTWTSLTSLERTADALRTVTFDADGEGAYNLAALLGVAPKTWSSPRTSGSTATWPR